MTDFTILPPEVTATFIDLARQTTFPMSLESGTAFLDALPITIPDPSGTKRFRRFANTTNAVAMAGANDNQITDVSCWLCDGFPEPTAEQAALLDDVFTDAVTRVAGLLGKPTSKSRNENPKVSWMLDNGGRITVRQSSAVVLELESPWMIRLDNVTV